MPDGRGGTPAAQPSKQAGRRTHECRPIIQTETRGPRLPRLQRAFSPNPAPEDSCPCARSASEPAPLTRSTLRRSWAATVPWASVTHPATASRAVALDVARGRRPDAVLLPPRAHLHCQAKTVRPAGNECVAGDRSTDGPHPPRRGPHRVAHAVTYNCRHNLQQTDQALLLDRCAVYNNSCPLTLLDSLQDPVFGGRVRFCSPS